MARAPRRNATISTNTVFEWDDRVLQEIFRELSPESQTKAHLGALRRAGNKLARVAKEDAASAGLARTGVATKDGWTWTRLGRIPRAVRVGKVWQKKKEAGARVFVASGRKYGLLGRAPHANPIIAGYNQHVPNRDGTTRVTGHKSGRGIFNAARTLAPTVFEQEVEKSVKLMVNRINRRSRGG